jgi:hypothetical protein
MATPDDIVLLALLVPGAVEHRYSDLPPVGRPDRLEWSLVGALAEETPSIGPVEIHDPELALVKPGLSVTSDHTPISGSRARTPFTRWGPIAGSP